MIRELAENANTYTPLGPDDERIATGRYVLWMGRGDAPGWNVAQRFRLGADEVELARADYSYVNTGSLEDLDEFVASVMHDLTS